MFKLIRDIKWYFTLKNYRLSSLHANKARGFSYLRLETFLLLFALAIAPTLQAKETVRLVTGEFQPYTSKTLRNGGPMTQLIREAFEAEGYEVEVSFEPWKRGYQRTLEGIYDATFPYSFNTDRAKHFSYSTPLRQRDVHIFALKQSNFEYRTADDLKGLRFCTGLGYNVFPEIQGLIDQRISTLHVVPNIENCLNMIVQGRADATYMNEEVAWKLINLHVAQPELYEEVGPPIHIVKESLIVSKRTNQTRELIQRFNHALERIKTNGRYQTIMRQLAD